MTSKSGQGSLTESTTWCSWYYAWTCV